MVFRFFVFCGMCTFELDNFCTQYLSQNWQNLHILVLGLNIAPILILIQTPARLNWQI